MPKQAHLWSGHSVAGDRRVGGRPGRCTAVTASAAAWPGGMWAANAFLAAHLAPTPAGAGDGPAKAVASRCGAG
jgi:hypothetical protein